MSHNIPCRPISTKNGRQNTLMAMTDRQPSILPGALTTAIESNLKRPRFGRRNISVRRRREDQALCVEVAQLRRVFSEICGKWRLLRRRLRSQPIPIYLFGYIFRLSPPHSQVHFPCRGASCGRPAFQRSDGASPEYKPGQPQGLPVCRLPRLLQQAGQAGPYGGWVDSILGCSVNVAVGKKVHFVGHLCPTISVVGQ